jgi:hypothetical protein
MPPGGVPIGPDVSRYEAPQRPAGPQLGWVVAAILAIALVGVGSATAGSLLTGKQVRNGSLTGLDIRDRSIKAKDIALGSITPKHLRKGTSAVTIGQPGPAGPAGATGAAGASGPRARRASTARSSARPAASSPAPIRTPPWRPARSPRRRWEPDR